MEATGRVDELRADWLAALRAYLATIAVGNLLWETLHLPFHRIWRAGSLGENAFAVVHCTFGDLLIALSALTLALVVTGDRAWPAARFRHVAALAVAFGLGYTAFSEWLNIIVRAAWAYSDLMPVVSVLGPDFGLSPLLQWIVVPLVALTLARRRGNAPKRERRHAPGSPKEAPPGLV